MALKVRTMKLDNATWERWQVRAAVASTSVAALIIASMEGAEAAHSVIDGLKACVEPLRDRVLELTKAIQAKDARIAALEREIIARAKPISGALAALRADPAMKAIDPKVHHVSGPVLADAVPRAVEGQAVGFNPKKSWKADDDKGKKP